MTVPTRRLLIVLAGCAAVSLVAEFLIQPEAHGAWWHGVAGFDLAIGFVGCGLLVWGSKLLGQFGLQQPEDDHPEDEP
jgi:hypothetical protein